MEDVANGLLLAGERGQPGETHFLAGHVLVMREILRVWGEAIGRLPPFIWLPRPVALAQAALVAPRLRLLGQPAFILPGVVRSSFVSFSYRSDKAVDQLEVVFMPAEQAWEETLREEVARAQSGRV